MNLRFGTTTGLCKKSRIKRLRGWADASPDANYRCARHRGKSRLSSGLACRNQCDLAADKWDAIPDCKRRAREGDRSFGAPRTKRGYGRDGEDEFSLHPVFAVQFGTEKAVARSSRLLRKSDIRIPSRHGEPLTVPRLSRPQAISPHVLAERIPPESESPMQRDVGRGRQVRAMRFRRSGTH